MSASDFTELEIETGDDQPQNIPVVPAARNLLAAERRRQMLKDQIDQARAFGKFGSKVLKVKLKTCAEIGEAVEKAGAKKIGHGKYAIAGDAAQAALAMLVDIAHQLYQTEPEKNVEKLIEVTKEIRALNDQIISSGKAHIEADKQAISVEKGPSLTIPFPAGAPVVVGVSTQPRPSVESPKES